MRLWRLTRARFADLSGQGAYLYGGRWNSPGRYMVYCAADAALTVLEVRVHLDLPFDLLPDDYMLMEIDAGELPMELGPELSKPEACRAYGDAWLTEGRSALLAVPSAIVPESRNVLINPAHSDAPALAVASLRPWRFDPRLF